MLRGIFAESSPFTQLVMLAFTMLACVLMFLFIGILLTPLIFNVPIAEQLSIINGGDNARHINLLRYLQTLQGIGLFIVPAFTVAYLFSGNAVAYLGFRRQNSEIRTLKLPAMFGLTLLLMLAAIPFINLLAALNEMVVFPESLATVEKWLKNFEESAQQTTKLFLNVDNIRWMFFNIFMIALLPAIGEELIFRGVLHKIFVRWTGSVHIAIIVTGFLFSAMHLQFYGFFPRWLLGVMFGYMLVWSGTIWLPVFAHFVNNATAVFLYWLIHKKTVSGELEVFGTNQGDIPVTVVATVVSAALLWIIYRNGTGCQKNS